MSEPTNHDDERQTPSGRGRSKAIVAAALAIGKTVKSAARSGRVSERSVYRWLAQPRFRSRVDALRERLVDEAVGAMSKDMGKAARSLATLMSSRDERVRLRACVAFLALGLRTREHTEVIRRLAELEGRFNEPDGPAPGAGANDRGPGPAPDPNFTDGIAGGPDLTVPGDGYAT